jgi:hypothetical protein
MNLGLKLEILTRKVRMKRNELQGMHRKTRWKGDEFVIVNLEFFEKIISMKNDMPIKRYPNDMKKTTRMGAEEDLLNYQKSGNMEKIVLAGNVIDNRENELSKVCEMNLCNRNIRLSRQLQSISLQSFLQFKDPIFDGRKDAKDNNDFGIAPTCSMNILKLKFYGLKNLKESDISLENIFKKRRIKISSRKDELPINRYPGSNRIGLKKYDVMKFILAKSNDAVNMFELSKVCDNVIIKAHKSVNHKERSLLQFEKFNLEGREFLLENNCLKIYLMNLYDSKLIKYLMMKFKFFERKKQLEKGCCCDWIPSWLARSKYLSRYGNETEDNFGKKCKFKKKGLQEFVSKCKFKMKGLFYVDNGRFCSNGKSFNRHFSITLMCFWGGWETGRIHPLFRAVAQSFI